MDLPQPPQDNDLKNIIDKLAQFVARNGPEFESMTKTKQKNNPKFSFLFGGDYYNYYTYKVTTEQAILRQKSANIFPHQDDWVPQSGGHDAWSNQHQRPPRALMDIQPFPGSLDSFQGPSPAQLLEVEKLKEQISDAKQQMETLREQIKQSETNLAAQKEVTETQIKEATLETIQNSKQEHLELLAGDTGIDLEEMDTVMAPIIESCTKDSISSGKGWIFTKATSHDNNQLIAHYLAFRVTSDSAVFSLKLHLIYLMNDVLHHCARKSNEELKQSFESVAVEMFCSAWISSSQDSERAGLSKLIRLWDDKNIFSSSTLNKMRNAHESWDAYKQQLEEDCAAAIERQTKPMIDTYNSYEKQHGAFVNHALNTITSLDVQMKALEAKIDEAEEKKKQLQAEQQLAMLQQEKVAAQDDGMPINENNYDPNAAQDWSSGRDRPMRSSRWDTGEDGNYQGPMASHHSWNEANMYPPNQGYDDPSMYMPPHPPMPDLSRPPPGFGPPPPAYGIAYLGGTVLPQISYDEKQLVPTLPYYDLPAGLMVPLIHLEDSGYKPLDPSKIRLPPPIPPTPGLLAALEQFYAPPSHERPRDPDGWEMLGLYEYYKHKQGAVKAKADAIESGTRDRSRTASPDQYCSGNSTPEQNRHGANEKAGAKKKRYTSRSRSRTRSRSRESTPEFGGSSRKRRESKGSPPARIKRQRSYSRSPSPTGSYSLPSYLSKSKKTSPDVRREPSRSPSDSPPPRKSGRGQRSPSPGEYVGFGASKKLDSSNKGHQMMQKMGWKGSGLGFGETGIVDPVSGGEVRDKSEQFRGVGTGSDPFEAFRKTKAGSFYTRMKDREKDRNSERKSGGEPKK